jgi:hypothetical protein
MSKEKYFVKKNLGAILLFGQDIIGRMKEKAGT